MFTPLAVGGWQGLVESVLVHSAGSYLRLIDSGVTQLETQGLRSCDEGKEEEEERFTQFNV